LQYANDAVAAGALLAGGAFNPPAEGGLLLFSSTREKVEDFAKKVTTKQKYRIHGFYYVLSESDPFDIS
jgi:hypothetical protein